MKKYKAAFVYREGEINLEEIEQKELKPDEVLIEIYEANICPTDIRGYRGVKELKHPERVGHEFAGYIAEVGEKVKKFKKGDRVTALSWTPCYVCTQCTQGRYSNCENKTMNMGGFAEYITLNENVVYKIPENLSFEKASCAEPLASVLKANIEITPIEFGDTVIVYGLGPMGQLHAQVAKFRGASKVIGIDLIEDRLNLALQNGIDYVINPKNMDPIETVKKITNEQGANVIIVAVGGAAEALCTELSMEMVAYRGKINIFTGTYPLRNISINPNLIHYKEVVITGTKSYNLKTFELALDLLANDKINIESIRYPQITLDEIKYGFDIHGTPNAMKVAVKVR